MFLCKGHSYWLEILDFSNVDPFRSEKKNIVQNRLSLNCGEALLPSKNSIQSSYCQIWIAANEEQL